MDQTAAPEKAALRESAMLDADDELPGVGISSHPLWSILARCLPYKEKWNTTVATPMHINLLELKAFLIEEQKIASTFYGKRCLSALDSQVCLGALIKGRSSSPGINRMLQRALCYLLGSGLSNYFMYYLSEENRADGPSRKRSPEPPDVAQPLWIDALELGDYGPFDAWISSLSSDFQLQPFDYSSLENGNHTDLRPNSDMPSRQRRRIGRSLKFSTSTASDAASEPQPTSSTTTVGALPSSCISVGDLCRSETRSSPETGVREPSVVEGALESDNVAPSLGQGKKTLSDLKKMKYGGLLEHFSLDQFVFKGDFPDLDQPGALDLFSGSLGVAKQMALHGAPWILTFDWDRSPAEDLLQVSLREKLVASIRSGFFRSVGMAPICASFSKAVTPPVRTNRFPRGKPGLSKNMRKKVSEGNSHADFCALLISICIEMKISYFLENPDSSWMWRLKGYECGRDPGSNDVFRLCFCRFGTSWRKATRIITSTRLRGLRMMCTCRKRHFQLRGFSQLHKKMWTKVAEPYPRGLARLLALSLCCQAGWCEQKKLSIAGCCRAASMRIGEASLPGPGRRPFVARTTLENLPLLSAHTQELGAKQLRLFLRWCSSSLKRRTAAEIFDAVNAVPSFAGQCLRSYGDYLYQHGGALSNFRHCILAFQRWKPTVKPFLEGPWELVRRWELQQPVSHRPPLPEGMVKSFVALAWCHGWFEWCAVTLIAFYGAGRLGEVLRCARGDLILPCDTVGELEGSAFLEFRRFKSLHRQPSKIQHMRIEDITAIGILTKVYSNYLPGQPLFDGTPNQYRRRWDFVVAAFSIPKTLRLTPGGLRGGSAVAAYRRGVHVTTIQWNLRLRHLSTLESYIQETASLTIFTTLSSSSRTLLNQVAKLYPLLRYAANHQGDASAS